MRTKILCSSVLLALLSACGGGSATTSSTTQDTNTQQAVSTAKSSLVREPAPMTSDADVATAVAGNTQFALTVMPMLDKQGDSNLVFSPYSITQALAMTSAGAKADTLSGIEKAMDFQLPQNRLLPALNKLDLQLTAKTAGAGASNANLPSLNIANSLWAQQGYTLQSSFLDALAVNFGAAVNLLDFFKSPDASRMTINNWVANQTNQKIQNLLAPNSVTSGTRVVLTNAIWFKSDWASPFTAESTRSQDFTDRKGNTSKTSFMYREANYSSVQGAGYQAVDLPYVDNKLSMLVVMPDAGKFDSFLQNLTPSGLNDISNALKDQRIGLALPKFNFNASPDMGGNLISLGMADAFNPAKADFSGMTGNRDLSISGVVHKAFITVDEKGTEAAAATGVVIGITAVMPPPVRLTFDHPFLFMIRDRQTGLIIFMGKVMNPAVN